MSSQKQQKHVIRKCSSKTNTTEHEEKKTKTLTKFGKLYGDWKYFLNMKPDDCSNSPPKCNTHDYNHT